MTKEMLPNHSRSIALACGLLMIVALVGIPSAAAADVNATVSTEDVQIDEDGGTGVGEVSIDADENVNAADTKVEVDSSVAEIVNATRVDSPGFSELDIDIAEDGSSVWLNFTDINGSYQLTVAEVEYEAQTAGERTDISLQTENYKYLVGNQSEEFDYVNTAEGVLTAGVEATVSSETVSIPEVGGTGNSTISVEAPEGLGDGAVEVSVNMSVANISGVSEEGDGVSVENESEDSVVLNHTGESDDGQIDLAEVEFTLLSDDETPISLDVMSLSDPDGTDYVPVVDEGDITSALFDERLMDADAFEGPPQNIPEDDPAGINDTLYEDLTGDGDGLELSQSVAYWGHIVRKIINEEELDLNEEQQRALNWSPNSPKDEVTLEDMVALWGKQVREQL